MPKYGNRRRSLLVRADVGLGAARTAIVVVSRRAVGADVVGRTGQFMASPLS
ncbi:MAG: hypothetical protein QMD04_04675 [Anaerolineales bacterium]|nr:hypothetical protein [Anaerolineales bacterium]